MAKSHKQTITQLSKGAGLEIDEALIRLWDAGFDEINSPSDLLSGARLNQAKKCLGLASKRQITSLSYWQNYLRLGESDLAELLTTWGFAITKATKTLPPGVLRKLKSYSAKKLPTGSTLIQSETSLPEVKVKESMFVWKIVGREREVRYLNLEEIRSIHFALCRDFLHHSDPIEPQGIRDLHLIESAIFRQHTSVGDTKKYPTVEMTAAALLHSMVHNHPFFNGNKRTALVAMLVLLDENGLMLTTNEDSLFKFILQVAQHRITDNSDPQTVEADAEVIAIAEWIKANSRSIELGEKPLSFRKLRQILLHHKCEFHHSTSGCNVKITRKVKRSWWSRSEIFTVNISYGNAGRDVSRKKINMVRAELQLDENNGVDSAAFYEDVPVIIDDFIGRYRKILQRLAKV